MFCFAVNPACQSFNHFRKITTNRHIQRHKNIAIVTFKAGTKNDPSSLLHMEELIILNTIKAHDQAFVGLFSDTVRAASLLGTREDRSLKTTDTSVLEEPGGIPGG